MARISGRREGLTGSSVLVTLFATVLVSFMKLNLQQLSERTELPARTIRFYIQKGLIPGPEGEKRGAYYTQAHLAELLRIRSWQEAGLSLEAIGDLLQARQEPPLPPARPGAIEVRSHLVVTEGVELVIAPERAHLTQSQLRQLFREVQAAHARIVGADTDSNG